MKKISKIGIIMCMIAMFTMLLAGCDLVKKDDNKKEINKEELSGYTEYVDSSGVKFSYPSDWKNLGTTSKPVFGETSTGTSVNYLSESIPKMYNLTSYMAAAVKNVKESMHIDTDIEEEEVKLNGRDAAILTYKITQDGSEIMIKQVCFIADDAAHILTIATLEKNYNDKQETIDKIISSYMK